MTRKRDSKGRFMKKDPEPENGRGLTFKQRMEHKMRGDHVK